MAIYVDPGKLNSLGDEIKTKTTDLKNCIGEVENANNFLLSSWKSDSSKQYSRDVDDKIKLLKNLVDRLNSESDGLKGSSTDFSRAERDIGDMLPR